MQRRRLDAAFEWGRLYVPNRVHADLVMLNNHGGGEQALWQFYEDVCEEYTNGAKARSAIDTDLIRFWKARYTERWPADTKPAPKDTGPVYQTVERSRPTGTGGR